MFIKLAVDENGHVKVSEDGKPYYLDDKDKEVTVDPPQMYQKIIDLGTENKKLREGTEGLQARFASLDGVEDVDEFVTKANKALEQVENFDDKDWMDVKKVDSLKEQMKEAHKKELKSIKAQFEETVGSQTTELEKKNFQIRKLMVSNRFSNSPLFAGTTPKTIMTPDIAEAFFGHHFKVEEDEKNGNEPVVRAYFATGDPVISASPERVGELATFNEAIEIIFDNYPNRDQYIKGKGKGSGAGGGGGGDEGDTDLGKLRAQYAEAEKNRDTASMIAIKNKITTLSLQK